MFQSVTGVFQKDNVPVLRARNIVKSFSHVQVLNGVDFEVYIGDNEIVSLFRNCMTF